MPAQTKTLLWFNEIDKDDGNIVGGKGANLGEMTQAGFPVPEGFVLTAQSYFKMLDENNLRGKIRKHLENIDVENPQELNRASAAVKDLIEKATVPKNIEKDIRKAYHKLGKNKQTYVAVRSSATAEDLPEASFAGQQETFLNIKGDNSLIHHVRKAWASLFEPRAIYYRERQGFDHFKVGIALPIQRMIQSDVSGIMFTINPIDNDKKTILIESIWGLGEKIVQGAVTPDHFEVDRNKMKITKKSINKQEIEMVKKNGKTFDAKIPRKRKKKQTLLDEKVIELAKIGKKLHQHYFFPQDIEWGMENNTLYILQTRPITTIKATETAKKVAGKRKQDDKTTGKLLIKGDPASPGRVTGIVKVVKSAKQIDKIKSGDILVTSMTTPDFVPAMKRAVAIVTNEGGQTSHAAIVSRELGVPCVVGTKKATKTLKNGDVVIVDGEKGKVFKSNLKPSSVKQKQEQEEKEKAFYESQEVNDLKTATKLYVNLGEPSLASEVAKNNVDGVGLLRAEFMIAEIGTHPKRLIKKGKQEEFIQKLAEGMEKFTKAFSPRPVIYRTTDFKTNEYRNLKGGEEFEPEEPNPMIGYRGAFRYITDHQVFELELEAIKRVRNKMGYKNLSIMIPFVRSVNELKEVKKIILANGLSRSQSFKLWMMVEIPVNVILLDDFIKVGIDGVSIGTNDLTMLILGTDRDNEHVRDDYDERNPAVIWALEKIVKTCQKHKITSSICGQAPSVYPEITEVLVKNGITSVSVTPDMINKTRQIIYDTEHKLLKNKSK